MAGQPEDSLVAQLLENHAQEDKDFFISRLAAVHAIMEKQRARRQAKANGDSSDSDSSDDDDDESEDRTVLEHIGTRDFALARA